MPIVKSYYKVLRVNPDPEFFYIQNEYAGSNTFTLTKQGTPDSTDLEYSKDKTTWTDIHGGGTVSMNQGEKVYLRSTTGLSNSNSRYYKIGCSQNYSVGGKIATLFDWQNVETFTAIPNGGLYSLFKDQTHLISILDLDFSGITSVGDYGCCNLFSGCTSLTTGPDMSSFEIIHSNGLSLTFQNCTSLTTAPDLSGLVDIYDFGCGQCFDGCTSLTTGPDIKNITSLRGTYPMANMFRGCSSLNYVTTPNISNWNTGFFSNWLKDVAANGIVSKPTNLNIPTDSISGVPTGWTTQNY